MSPQRPTPREIRLVGAWRWPHFTPQELACKETGLYGMDPAFMDKLQNMRRELGFAFPINSAYRHPTHPVEAKKANGGGSHTYGRAVDIRVTGEEAYKVVTAAEQFGFTGIGVHKAFIHLDDMPPRPHAPRPWLWLY